MKTQCSEKGFTLAEVLITIALLGILAAMVLPRLTGQTDRARAAEAINMLGAIRQALVAYANGPAGGDFVAVGEWNTCFVCGNYLALGLGDPHVNANRSFDYGIQIFSSDGSAVADQVLVVAESLQNPGEIIAINGTGVWSGTSPYVPANLEDKECANSCELDGTNCDTDELPGPCY